MPRLAPRQDYGPIKDEYVSTEISIRALARKVNVSFGALAERARKEGWLSLRQAHGRQVAARTYEGMLNQIAEQERAIRLEQLAVLRATLHTYAKDMKDGKVHVGPKDAILAVDALSRLLGVSPVDSPDGSETAKNVTPTDDARDPQFWRDLVEHARTQVATSGGVGTTPLAGTPKARSN